jgi:phytol kinase
VDGTLAGGLGDYLLMLLCYGYIVGVILVSGRLGAALKISHRASRKFLHAMIGNFPFIVPFFRGSIFPFLVAAPFIPVTFLATPYSPFQGLRERMNSLAHLTEEGHHMGLVLYAVSYTVLALLFASRPWIIAAGILPMAYGDSAAALVGESRGRRRFRVVNEKSVEGSAAMFAASFLSLMICVAFMSLIYPFSALDKVLPVLAVAAVVTVAEALSPAGLDNIAVPLLGALTFLTLGGW